MKQSCLVPVRGTADESVLHDVLEEKRKDLDIDICGSSVSGVAETLAMSRPDRFIKDDSSPKNLKTCKSVSPLMISEKKRQKSKQEIDGQKSGSPFLVILTAEQARTIYQLRSVSTAEDASARSVAGKSSLVSEIFGVSPKTIRDVWNRKTWTQVSHLTDRGPQLQIALNV
jgi:hypothetical protein